MIKANPLLIQTAQSAALFTFSILPIKNWLIQDWNQETAPYINATTLLIGCWLSISLETLKHSRFHNIGNTDHKQRRQYSTVSMSMITGLNLLTTCSTENTTLNASINALAYALLIMVTHRVAKTAIAPQAQDAHQDLTLNFNKLAAAAA